MLSRRQGILWIAYSGKGNTVHYICDGRRPELGGSVCAGFGSTLLRALEPEAIQQADLALERARYEADRAFRQYDAVDPGNRQLVDELERRWNERLVATSEAEEALSRSRDANRAYRMGDAERSARLALGRDIERASGAKRGSRRNSASGPCGPPSSKRRHASRTAGSGLSCTGRGRPKRDRRREAGIRRHDCQRVLVGLGIGRALRRHVHFGNMGNLRSLMRQIDIGEGVGEPAPHGCILAEPFQRGLERFRQSDKPASR